MKQWRERATCTIYMVLAAIVVADVFLLAYAIVARHSANMSQLYFRNPLQARASAPFDGYSAAGAKITFDSAPTRGWAVRYASQACPHCRADEQQWNELKSQLLEKGYRIYVIPPSAQDAYPNDASSISGATQLPYVNVEWIKQYRLTGTPTTLLFSGSGKMFWSHLGEISKSDRVSALIAVTWNNIGGR